MNDSELDELLAAAAPIHDADVAGLPLSGSDELCEAIVSTPVIESIGTPDPSGDDPAGSGGPPRRSHRSGRWWRSRRGLAVAGAAVAASVTAVVVVQPFGADGGGSAWAAEALEVAESVPRLLITADGWEVSRADEFGVDSGEMTFRGPDGAEIELQWNAETAEASYDDFLAGLDQPPYERLEDVEVRGQQAALFEASFGPSAVESDGVGPSGVESRPVEPGDLEQEGVEREGFDPHSVTALWRDSGYVVRLESPVATDRFLDVAASIEAVDVDTWLSAMPESVVKAGDRPGAVQQMLAGIPLPDGFDASSLEATDVSAQDRYQLGAEVTGQVACAWVAQWSEGKASGDTAKVEEAIAAMGTSRDWAILHEMEAEGAWPEVLWEVADAMAAGDTMDAGAPDMPLAEVAANALGCETGAAPVMAG